MEGKPQWVHPLEEAELAAAAAANGTATAIAAEGAAGADAQDNLAHAWRACKLAQEVRGYGSGVQCWVLGLPGCTGD